MKQCILILLFSTACAKTQTQEIPEEANNDCQTWDTIIDSSAEFLCAIKLAENNSELIINKASLAFDTPVIVKKSFRFSSELPLATVSGPAFTFEKLVKFDTISFNANTIRTQGASFKNAKIYGAIDASVELILENVVSESKVNFKGAYFSSTGSKYPNAVNVNANSLQISTNRFDGNVEIASAENAYINNNVFLGENRKTNLTGPDLFVENNCRNETRKWTSNKKYSGNRIHNKCTFAKWCSINEPVLESPTTMGAFNATRIKVGDFNGDGIDELIRIEENHWHHYDFKTRKWSFLSTELNTPPWAIGVADLDGDGVDSLVKADGYLLYTFSKDRNRWIDGENFEEGFARQYFMIGNIRDDRTPEFVKYDRREDVILTSKNGGLDWKKETPLKKSFTKLELIDVDGDGFDELILHQPNKYLVYEFTKKTWKSFPGSKSFPTVFGSFSDGIGSDTFINANQISNKKTKTLFKEKRTAAFVADTNGDGIDEIFSEAGCSSSKETKRIATYNLNHAGVRNVEELGLKIKRIDADFIVLQEIDRNTKRNPYDMVTKLVEYSGYKYFEFFKSNTYQGGEYGLLVLSKSPIKNATINPLPAHADSAEWPEQNIAVSLESGNRSFVVTHVIARKWKGGQDLSKTQDAQMLALTKLVKKKNPDFVLGDFNIKPDSDAYKRFVKTTGFVDSFPAIDGKKNRGITFPDIHGEPRRIDYVFSKPDIGTHFRAEIPAWISSDHYPYIVHFD